MFSTINFFICVHPHNHHPDHGKKHSITLEDFFITSQSIPQTLEVANYS